MHKDPGFKLDENEVVQEEVRRHWIALAPTVASAISLVIAAFGVAYGVGRYPTLLGPVLPLVTLLGFLLIIMAAAIGTIGLWVYRQNKLILTNLHLIQVEQAGLFNRTTSQLSLARVQDVTGSSRGLIQTMLGFGDVIVQTAGEKDKFSFDLAPSPAGIADRCLQAHEDFVAANPTRGL